MRCSARDERRRGSMSWITRSFNRGRRGSFFLECGAARKGRKGREETTSSRHVAARRKRQPKRLHLAWKAVLHQNWSWPPKKRRVRHQETPLERSRQKGVAERQKSLRPSLALQSLLRAFYGPLRQSAAAAYAADVAGIASRSQRALKGLA